jgi:hypothetical protein
MKFVLLIIAYNTAHADCYSVCRHLSKPDVASSYCNLNWFNLLNLSNILSSNALLKKVYVSKACFYY